MGRYLLLEFDNDAQAEGFADKVRAASDRGQPYRLKGIFGKPRTVCTCPDMDKPEKIYRGHVGRWVVGRKFGWTVHRGCGRAKPGTQWPYNIVNRDRVETLRGDASIRFHIDMIGHTTLQAVTLVEEGQYAEVD